MEAVALVIDQTRQQSTGNVLVLEDIAHDIFLAISAATTKFWDNMLVEDAFTQILTLLLNFTGTCLLQ